MNKKSEQKALVSKVIDILFTNCDGIEAQALLFQMPDGKQQGYYTKHTAKYEVMKELGLLFDVE